MVTYEFICQNRECQNHGLRFDSLLKSWDAPDPNCPSCGQVMERQFPAPKCVFTRPYHWYDVNTEQRHQNYNNEGVKVVRRNTEDGEPRVEYLTTYQQVKEYCKAEGLAMPGEVNPNIEVGKDGRMVSTRGITGQWV